MARRISLLNSTWAETIVTDALKEIFAVFQRVISDHKEIGERHRESILKKQHHFDDKEKSVKSKLKALNKILNPATINEEEKLAVSDKIVPQEEVAEENEIKDVKRANASEQNQ